MAAERAVPRQQQQQQQRPRVLVVGDTFVDVLAGPVARLPLWGRDTASPLPITAVPGGSAQNTAAGLAALGVPITLYSAVGGPSDSFADVVRARLRSRGVEFIEAVPDAEAVPNDGGGDGDRGVPPPTGVCVVLSGATDRAFVSHYGVSNLWGCDALTVDDLRQYTHVHIGGYFSCARMQKTLPEFLERCAAAGCTTSIDTNDDVTTAWDPQFVFRVLPLIDVYLPNDHEAGAFAVSVMNETGCTYDGSATGAADLLAKWVRGAVVMTRGDEAAYGRMGRTAEMPVSFNARPPAVDRVVDTVGCGDAYNAAFLSQFVRCGLSPGEPLPVEMLQHAALVGAINGSYQVTQRGASESVATVDDLVAFCNAVEWEWPGSAVGAPPLPPLRGSTATAPTDDAQGEGDGGGGAALAVAAAAVAFVVGVAIGRELA